MSATWTGTFDTTRSDAISYRQDEHGWVAVLESNNEWGMWGVGPTPFDAVNDLSEALSEAAQCISRMDAP